MKVKTKKILYIYIGYTTFVRTDFEILCTKYDVTKYHFLPFKKLIPGIYQMLRQLVYLLFYGWKYDAFYIWFGDYHSLLPVLFAKVFGKKSFLVIGGYDVARIPNLKYGSFIKKYRGFCTINSFRYASKNICISKYIQRKVNWLIKKENSTLIYNCVNFEDKTEPRLELKHNLIITVGVIETEQTFYLKGIDTFIETAKLLPEYKFLIIGLDKTKLNHLLKNLPENLAIEGKLPHEALAGYYLQAKIYCQLSRSESFGVALAEGMFYNCIPIVTNVGGMPEVVGDTGYIVKRNEIEIAETIHGILNIEISLLDFGRKRIKSLFSISERTNGLIELLNMSETK